MVRISYLNLIFCLVLCALELQAGQYADQVYPAVRKKHPDIITATNNYMIAIEEKKIARADLLPAVNLETEATYYQYKTDGQRTKFNSEIGTYLTFEQPLYDIQRWYSLARGKKNEQISKMQQNLQELQFRMTFAEGLLRVSQGKTRYFFSRQNLEYFKTYVEKEKKREEADFLIANPGQPFNWRKSLTLLTLDQDLRAFERHVDVLRNAYMAEKVAFEVSILQGELKNFILVDPFVRRPKIVMTEKEAENYVRLYNPSVMIARQGVELSDINLREAKKLRWPTASLFARTGISSHGYNTGSDRIRDDMVGVQFTIPLFEGGAIRSKQKAAELEKENSKQRVIALQMQVAQEAIQLHQRLDLASKNIDSLIESFEASKEMVNTFLAEPNALRPDQNFVEPATNADRKSIMDTHFTISRDLALEQHTYLLSLLRLYFLLGNLDMKQLGAVEDRFFVACEDYERFIQLANKPN